MRNKKFTWLIGGVFLIIFLITVATTFYLNPKFKQISTPSTTTAVQLDNQAVEEVYPPAEATNESNTNPSIKLAELTNIPDQLGILLLGYGGAGHQGGALSDAIQVMVLDRAKQKIALISIPRDLSVTLDSGKTTKINSAMTMSGSKTNLINSGQNAKAVVSKIIGLPIQYFASVNFTGFERLIGQNLKGIEVDVSETLEDRWYPIRGEELNPCGHSPEEIAQLTATKSGFELEKEFACRYEHLLFEKGINKMQGGDALKYVRSRHGSGNGDFSRGRRQQEILTALGRRLVSLDLLKNTKNIYQTISQNVTTDLDLDAALFIASSLPSLPDWEVEQINLNTTNVLTAGQSSTILPKAGANNWTEIQIYIQSQW